MYQSKKFETPIKITELLILSAKYSNGNGKVGNYSMMYQWKNFETLIRSTELFIFEHQVF